MAIAEITSPDCAIDARRYADAWRKAQPALDEERLRALRALGETDAALLFARLLRMCPSLPLRESSGLVEQQRVFSRMRAQQR